MRKSHRAEDGWNDEREEYDRDDRDGFYEERDGVRFETRGQNPFKPDDDEDFGDDDEYDGRYNDDVAAIQDGVDVLPMGGDSFSGVSGTLVHEYVYLFNDSHPAENDNPEDDDFDDDFDEDFEELPDDEFSEQIDAAAEEAESFDESTEEAVDEFDQLEADEDVFDGDDEFDRE